MGQKQYFLRIFGFLMAMAVFLAHGSTYSQIEKKGQNSNEAQVSVLSQDVVVPSFDFDFGNFELVFPKLEAVFFEDANYIAYFKFAFLLPTPYFDKLFEHFIAPNAP
jgi:hypothetical protein